jgi:hypothetical protein
MAAVPPPPAGVPAAPVLPLPVPAPVTATFASLFNDATLDPTEGNVGALLQPFLHDLLNAANNTTTDVIKNKLAQSGAQRRLIATTILSGGRARLYTCPYRWDDDLIAVNPDLNNKFFAFEGELIANQGHTVCIDDSAFHLLNNAQPVPTPAIITAGLAADPTLITLGPFNNGDADTEAVKTRRIVAVPHFLAGLWLRGGDGLTPREFWELVYPTIVTENKEGECKALPPPSTVALIVPASTTLTSSRRNSST